MEFYIFDDKETAMRAESYIRQVANFPRISVDINGTLRPDAQMTMKWANIQQRMDGKWVFPAVPYEIIIKYPQSVVDEFNANFLYIIEEYNSEWFEQLE
jgi:hypothetical protein